MAAEEKSCSVGGKKIGGVFYDADFGAAGVGDESVGRGVACDFGEKIESGPDGEREVDEIGVFQGGGKLIGKSGVDSVARLGFVNDFGAVPAGYVDVGGVFAESQGKRAAD
jgi:hypothetical protein